MLVGLALLAGNAFFVGAEFAIMSVRRAQLEPLAEQGTRGAATALWAVQNVSLMLACAQLGITICSTGLGAVAEPALAGLVEAPLLAAGLPAEASHVVGFTLALLIVVYLHVVLGEMVPKNLAVAGPERAALLFAPPLVWIGRAVSPVIGALNWLANHMLTWVGVQPKDEVSATFTAEEVASIVERSQAEGVLDDDLGLISGAIEFSAATAGEVMVPLAEVDALPASLTPAEFEAAVTRTGFSRFPIERQGELVGYLHLKDVLYATTERDRHDPVPPWRIRGLTVAGRGDEVEDVLGRMQRTGAHLALVTGDAGELAAGGSLGRAPIGIVFLEDILEELVGEVRDSMQRIHHLGRRPGDRGNRG
nr:hemolysin family protein [Pseudactinotalea sp. HY160]